MRVLPVSFAVARPPFGLAMLLCMLAALQPTAGYAADGEGTVDDDGFFDLGWLDRTQANASARANSLAGRVDRFFGVERSDLEAAYSSLRFGTEMRWTEGDGFEPRVRLRGRLYLPRVNERISLIFSEDKGEGASYYSQNELLNEPQSTRVNLEVNLSETDKHRFDYRIGLRSNLKLRTSVRYRFEDALSENMLHRLSETVYFIDDQGFGSFTQYQIDRELNDVSLIRWSNEVRAEEDLHGLEWSTSLNHVSSYDSNFAMIYFASASGLSDNNFVSRYQVGARLRRSIARPWLFLEVSPAYRWDKLDALQRREGQFFASIRLEMAIGRVDSAARNLRPNIGPDIGPDADDLPANSENR
ncbi:MAG: hypothetical protein RLZZ227_2214 [Pseudomonadota bacterium]|jgi:hypothetical protein